MFARYSWRYAFSLSRFLSIHHSLLLLSVASALGLAFRTVHGIEWGIKLLLGRCKSLLASSWQQMSSMDFSLPHMYLPNSDSICSNSVCNMSCSLGERLLLFSILSNVSSNDDGRTNWDTHYSEANLWVSEARACSSAEIALPCGINPLATWRSCVLFLLLISRGRWILPYVDE